jgi:hypothetical protein
VRVLTLAYYNIKRISRQKYIAIALLIAPLVMAVPRLLFARSHVALGLAWACPFACALFVCGLLYVQRVVDGASGLLAGLRSTPLSDRALLGSRVLAGASIFAAQMAIFGALITLAR